MTLADIDIAVRSKCDHQRLPQKPLSVRFIPIPPVSSHANGHEKLALGTELHHRGAIRVADPDIVLGIDGHAVRLLLVSDHVLAHLKDELVIPVELEELGFSGGGALKGPEVSFRIEGDRRDTTIAR